MPSILSWSLVNKMTPWSYVFAFGSTAAIGLAMKDSSLHMFVGDNIVNMNNFILQCVSVMAMTVVMTQIGSTKYVTEIMTKLSTLITFGKNSPAALFYPIIWCSNLTFLLPVSSLANCYGCGWGNVRAKDVVSQLVTCILLFECDSCIFDFFFIQDVGKHWSPVIWLLIGFHFLHCNGCCWNVKNYFFFYRSFLIFLFNFFLY